MCTIDSIVTPVADTAVVENSAFSIAGYGSGNIFAYGISEECLLQAREDGKQLV